ncbi:MAG: phosphatase PAP2 family protein [Candidatus Omnitrophica bacterium]|nr:phosphatase PAP2 family protein [Candidatus Omnitrophota bacterium]
MSNPRRAFLASVLALGTLSVLATQGVLKGADQQIAVWFLPLHSRYLDGPMQVLAWFGGSTWTILALLGLGALAWRRGGNAGALALTATFLAGALLQVFLRLWVSQWRPDAGAIPASMDLLTRFELAGFPSGHAYRSAFLFGWIARAAVGTRWERLLVPGCALMVGLVGITRVYLNRHWASDVLGAWLVVLTMLSLVRWWEERRSV